MPWYLYKKLFNCYFQERKNSVHLFPIRPPVLSVRFRPELSSLTPSCTFCLQANLSLTALPVAATGRAVKLKSVLEPYSNLWVLLITLLLFYREAEQLLQTNLKRNPSSQTEAIMQHELQRLTGMYNIVYSIYTLYIHILRLKCIFVCKPKNASMVCMFVNLET